MPTLESSAELERLMGSDRMARPPKPLGERSPSGEWDAWFTWPLGERRQLLRYMAPAGRGLAPDDAAMVMGLEYPGEALETWRDACLLARAGLGGVDAAEWEWQAAQDALADILGPAEVAAHLGVKTETVWQWRKRNLMPQPVRVVSRIPLWTRAQVMGWALETGRATVEYFEEF